MSKPGKFNPSEWGDHEDNDHRRDKRDRRQKREQKRTFTDFGDEPSPSAPQFKPRPKGPGFR